MALLPFDELNTPKVEVEPPEQYFSKMAISKEQKEERVETANDLMDVLLFFFALLAIEMESVSPDYDMVYRKFKKRFRDVVADHSRMDDYQNSYVDEYTLQQYELTKRHMEAAGIGSGNTDAGWWTSADRAMAIGENAANIILNHEELLQAAEAGAVGKKWIDKADNRVRKTHLAVTKKIIPLEEYFVVGDGVMLFPCDWDNNPDECHRCRCVLAYYDKDGKIVKVSGAANKRNKEQESYTFYADAKSLPGTKNEPQIITDDSYTDPNGVTYKVDGVNVKQDHDDEELATANLLAKKYNTDVHLIPRVLFPQHIKTPDYIIGGVRFDRKAIDGNGKHTLDSAVKEKREQANVFIFAARKTSMSLEEMVEQAEKILKNPKRDFVKKLIIEKDGKFVWEQER